MRRCVLLLILCLAAFRPLLAEKQQATMYFLGAKGDTVSSQVLVIDVEELCSDERPNPVLKAFKKKQRLNKRITAAVLAFPFPFGIVGLHRIYLGTKPYVPVAYVASLGGVFGILPFIDFCAITFDKKNFEHYKDNGQVFMWLNH